MTSRRSRHRRTARLVGIVLAGLAVAGGCSSSDAEVLRVYSGRHYDVELAFEQFAEETGVEVEFLNGNDAELRERIVAEGEDTQADVYLTVDAGNLARAAEQGVFQPLDSEVLRGAVPAELRDPDDLWFGLAVRVRTIVYASERMALDEVPASYEELAEPEWQGRVCMRNSSNVYQQSLVASLIAAHGEEEATEIVRGWAQNAEILANDVLILESIAEGLCDVGVANHYYLGRLLEENPELPVGLVWANQDDRGVHVNISGGGVTAHADDPELAQQFLEWLADKGQKVFVDSNHEYPANPAVEPEPLIAERFGTDFNRDPVNAAELGALNAEAVRVMDAAGFG